MVTRAKIAERVVESMLNRNLRPGERLGEQDRADQFGVSRTRVRESLMQLQARETYAARRVIDPGMLRDAGKPLQSVLRKLRQHVADERKAIASGDAATRSVLLADFDFRLAEFLGNRFLAARVVDLSARTTLVSALYQSATEAQGSNDDHAPIVAALAQGDTAKAEALMWAHIDSPAVRLDERLLKPGSSRDRWRAAPAPGVRAKRRWLSHAARLSSSQQSPRRKHDARRADRGQQQPHGAPQVGLVQAREDAPADPDSHQ